MKSANPCYLTLSDTYMQIIIVEEIVESLRIVDKRGDTIASITQTNYINTQSHVNVNTHTHTNNMMLSYNICGSVINLFDWLRIV